MPKHNSIDIHRFLAKLFHNSQNFEITDFNINQDFCDDLIKIGSNHLVLPAIFGAIKRKKGGRKGLVNFSNNKLKFTKKDLILELFIP